MLKKLKQAFNDISLRTKLLVLLFIAGILPLFFALLYNFYVSRTQLLKQAYETLDAGNRQIATNIDDQFSSVLQTASVLSQDFTLLDAISRRYTTDYDYVKAYQYIDHTFYNVLSTNTKISNLCVYTGNRTLPSDGLFIYHLQDAAGADLAWLRAERPGVRSVVFHGVQVGRKNENVISLGCVLGLYDRDYPQGYLVIDLKESALYALYETEAPENTIYVVDDAGNIQSTRDKTLLAQPLAAVAGLDAIPEESGVHLQRVGGQKALVVVNDLLNGWRVVTVAPVAAIYGRVSQATASTLLVGGLCLLVAFVLILYISHYFSSRFRQMNEQIARIENNDFQVAAYAAGKDEIGRLQAALGKMAATLEEAINETYIKEVQRKDAELTLLQSQINPHLLYNSLAGITSLALSGRSAEVVDFTRHLSQFYKTSLNRGKRVVPIREEIEITKHYIAIQNTRFRGMFHFSWCVDQTLLEHYTLKLVLQPFVENIVNHAVKDDDAPLEASVTIRWEKEDILFVLKDEGAGIPPDKLALLLDPQHTTGYGLINVNDRIKLHYGAAYGVTLESVLGQGTTATIRIPGNSTAES
ncbi:MAG: histidine kinase [Gemmiger sp.]|nr:histidine kinase [Gemmiger sp.]